MKIDHKISEMESVKRVSSGIIESYAIGGSLVEAIASYIIKTYIYTYCLLFIKYYLFYCV